MDAWSTLQALIAHLDPYRPACGLVHPTVYVVWFPEHEPLPCSTVWLSDAATRGADPTELLTNPWSLSQHKPAALYKETLSA